MQSYIEEFRGEHKRESDLVISICGPSGAGKGTLGRFMADSLDLNFYSAGDFFRDLAAEKGLSVEELSEQADKVTDVKVDRRTLEKGLNESCVIESRISAWVLGDYADLRIYVTADLEERARRMISSLEDRKNEKGAENLEEAKKIIEKRDRDNDQRYEDYYGIDTHDTSIFDLLIDNTELEIEEQKELVEKVLRRRFPERIEE